MAPAPKLALPKEHGSWGMFYIPVVLGLVAAGTWNVEATLFLIAGSALFLMREPFLTWWRLWRRGMDSRPAAGVLLIYGAVAAAAGMPLVYKLGRPLLLPQGIAVAIAMVWLAEATMRGWGRTVAAETVAVLASTSAAPAAYYAVRGNYGQGWLFWLLAALYFVGTVLYVKMRVTAAHARTSEQAELARWTCAAYHVLAPFAAAVLGLATARPWLIAAAFLPATVRALLRVALPSRDLNLKRTGWKEVVYSLVFLVLTVLAL
jgi:hypothetical protein